jgi:predicted nuclease of predicted toxin-antitoxin system
VKIKLDENIPTAVVSHLSTFGHDVDTVMDEGLDGRPDPDLWEGAQAAGRFLITQDLAFSDIRRFSPGTHASLLLVRLKKPGRRVVTERIRSIFAAHPVHRWSGCFVVATEIKVRAYCS